jgi:hypothetical protein
MKYRNRRFGVKGNSGAGRQKLGSVDKKSEAVAGNRFAFLLLIAQRLAAFFQRCGSTWMV